VHQPHKLVPLIWSNCADVATFALSRTNAAEIRKRFDSFRGPIDGVLFELPEQKADRALLELGTLLRALDDADGLSDELARLGDGPYGLVLKPDRSREDLYFRDMTNKILHARGFEWSDDKKLGPVINCVGNDPTRWLHALIRVDRLLALCGQLGLG
jgi:hypothetical protein